MGVVYKGFDPGIRRTVAIKTIRRELIEGDRPAAVMLARFRNEARAAGQLAHPGIVAVYDYGEDASVAYIAMEYVEGNSLREYFDRGTRFAERDVVSIMSQLLDALEHAHARRVWHRDIKPANLIVMMYGRLKVADFGIARIEASDLTHTGAVMGSPGYMAPEQYAAATIDHRADIFAAGVVFYQLLTGKRPFVGSPEQIAYAICHTDVPRPSLFDPSRNLEQYDAIVAQSGGAPAPARRYAGAWKESMACDALEDTGAFNTQVVVTASDGMFVLERGVRDQPGDFMLRGTPDPDGRLQLLGTGISGMPKYRGKPYNAGFNGRFDGERYDAPGRLGSRNCVLSISRAGS